MSKKDSLAPIGFVALHDATMNDFQVLAGGRISIQFSNVSVYRPVAVRQYEVWSHSAKLMMNGVTMLSVDGAWIENDDDYVLDDDIYTVSGEKVKWLEIENAEVHYIRFDLFSGACIGIACTRAALSIAEGGELVGHWVDDLGE
jgi:hypothetical protein